MTAAAAGARAARFAHALLGTGATADRGADVALADPGTDAHVQQEILTVVRQAFVRVA